MSTNVSPEITKKSQWWIPKNRYYELLHFCRQYRTWTNEKEEIINEVRGPVYDPTSVKHCNDIYDEVWNKIDKIQDLDKKINMVDKALLDADPSMSTYLFLAVTEGRSYAWLQTNLDIPGSKNLFYDRYRKFFWLLDKVRG